MKKVMVGLFTVALLTGLAAFSQDSTTSQSPSAQTSSRMPSDQTAGKAPLKNWKGTVKVDGDKVTFVNDKDGKSWDVMNPEELKPHEGHHIQVTAHVYADKNAINVMGVRMLRGESKKTETMSK